MHFRAPYYYSHASLGLAECYLNSNNSGQSLKL